MSRRLVPLAGDRDAAAVAILARALHGEAGGESLRALEAVAATIVNRARECGGPVAAACLAPGAFARRSAAPPDDPALALCRRVAARALAGALADPTGGATRSHRIGDLPAWALGRAPCTRIGERLFYR